MFDLSSISTYLVPGIVILCLCVGYIVKNLIPNDSVNRFIPLIAVPAGAAITVDVGGAGLVSGLASTGFYEGSRNLIGSKSDTKEVSA